MAELTCLRWGPATKGAPQELVVLCHGIGAGSHDLIDFAHAWAPALPNALFASVDAPFVHDSGFGRQWWSVADRAPSVMAAGARRAAPFLDAFIDAELQRQNLPPGAYALMGFSQGAMISLFAGLRHNPPPRAILAFSGALLAPERLAGEMTGHPPVLLVHGEADEAVAVSRSRDAEAVLRAAGIPVEATYIPRLGHGIDDTGISLGALALQKAFAGA